MKFNASNWGLVITYYAEKQAGKLVGSLHFWSVQPGHSKQCFYHVKALGSLDVTDTSL